ncbi:MAG: hypothetical protein KDA88_03815 [Planctomycetaceae bacterium]|nr:hypothetical protein [Planctomycetaceae bacterium]MCB9950879.1 hypothetical protein [Planctomycetaceae bacterium]
MNRSWSRRLQAASDGANAVSHQKTSAWEWLVAAVSIACVAVLAMYYASTDLGQFGEHVSRDKAPGGLPADATDISFCFGYRGIIAYEFSTDEQEFVEWVNSGIGSIESRAANVKIVPISEPISITRYNFLSDELTGPGTATISDGLYYRWNKEDEEVFAAYDRTLGRAYYYSHGF